MNKLFQLIACAIALMITTFAPAHADTLGRTTVGAQPSGALTPNYKRASKFVLTQPAVVEVMYAYLDGFGGPQSGSQDVSAVIYADNNGVPGRKLFQSQPTPIQAQESAGWHIFFGSDAPLPPGTYWLGLHSGGTVGIARDYGDGSTAGNWYANADSFADEASGTFGAGNSGPTTLSIYANYGATAPAFAGRSTVGATPSGGLSANFKRGSRITLNHQATAVFASAYIDGLGGGTAAQNIRFALYSDNGGVPGDLLTSTAELTVPAGKQGQWRSWSFDPWPLLAPGNYWVTILSGDTAGTVRDFADGAANWYGNADTYADGPSSSFGAGSTGTVTISAGLVYYPQDVTLATVGRTSVAATPSGGLSANFSRGSFYSAASAGGTVTGLWAYLDGKGGASGSQQVRMIVYADDGQGGPAHKIVWSDVLTINSGKAPGWVRFPISDPRSIGGYAGYWIVLQSGGTAGIVRDYGDGPANWAGEAAPFNATVPADFHTPGQYTTGTVETSMYLEYAPIH
jgi:hypothetical protein